MLYNYVTQFTVFKWLVKNSLAHVKEKLDVCDIAWGATGLSQHEIWNKSCQFVN